MSILTENATDRETISQCAVDSALDPVYEWSVVVSVHHLAILAYYTAALRYSCWVAVLPALLILRCAVFGSWSWWLLTLSAVRITAVSSAVIIRDAGVWP